MGDSYFFCFFFYFYLKWVLGHNSDSGVARTGVPKLSLAMYLFSVWIDEHVPLNVGTGSIFSREGPIMDFQRLGQKYFAGGTEVAKSHFDHSKLENNFLQKTLMKKCQISKS